jgi:hypothetical protein
MRFPERRYINEANKVHVKRKVGRRSNGRGGRALTAVAALAYYLDHERSCPTQGNGMTEEKPLRRGPRLRRSGERAKCRFCSRTLPRPKPRGEVFSPLLPGGSCPCGARFVVDPTGRNGGVALLEVLTDVVDGDRDRANFMIRGKDFEEYIENYEPHGHSFITGFKGYRRGMNRLYLTRLLDPADED